MSGWRRGRRGCWKAAAAAGGGHGGHRRGGHAWDCEPTLAAIREGKRIALANKETLVCAGELVMAEAERCGAEIVPVDSEHSAIFQCLQGCRDRREVQPADPDLLRRAVFRHGAMRNWSMMTQAGRSDSTPTGPWGPRSPWTRATLMNKGLEVIEAMRLYRLPLEQVEVVIHRQSIVHSLVEYRDGAVLAQLGTPDMRLPIRYALTWPDRAESPDRSRWTC